MSRLFVMRYSKINIQLATGCLVSIPSSPLEIEGFNCKGKYNCEKYAEPSHHNSCNAQEIMPVPKHFFK